MPYSHMKTCIFSHERSLHVRPIRDKNGRVDKSCKLPNHPRRSFCNKYMLRPSSWQDTQCYAENYCEKRKGNEYSPTLQTRVFQPSLRTTNLVRQSSPILPTPTPEHAEDAGSPLSPSARELVKQGPSFMRQPDIWHMSRGRKMNNNNPERSNTGGSILLQNHRGFSLLSKNLGFNSKSDDSLRKLVDRHREVQHQIREQMFNTGNWLAKNSEAETTVESLQRAKFYTRTRMPYGSPGSEKSPRSVGRSRERERPRQTMAVQLSQFKLRDPSLLQTVQPGAFEASNAPNAQQVPETSLEPETKAAFIRPEFSTERPHARKSEPLQRARGKQENPRENAVTKSMPLSSPANGKRRSLNLYPPPEVPMPQEEKQTEGAQEEREREDDITVPGANSKARDYQRRFASRSLPFFPDNGRRSARSTVG